MGYSELATFKVVNINLQNIGLSAEIQGNNQINDIDRIRSEILLSLRLLSALVVPKRLACELFPALTLMVCELFPALSSPMTHESREQHWN